ncbi:hypothetical protein Tcan_06610 [Toxocara canis]|uniref:UPAR/Ly6 domain-containing protein n=2 Tax=Toxocara canis TaxID=6265 RepID=A0A0B2UY60_TOXCA|nr:hypothetical protein Tcan_06610 [Toxocara canis]VDM43942.1 unnamed protein product [Toxocara canis]
MEITVLPLVGAMFMCASCLRCYHGANVAFSDNILTKTIRAVECGPLASFCRRAYGLINGKEGWILSCMARTSLGADYCVNGSECTEVISGSGKTSSQYMDCCCSLDMCNDENLRASSEEFDFVKLSNASTSCFFRVFCRIFIALMLLILRSTR